MAPNGVNAQKATSFITNPQFTTDSNMPIPTTAPITPCVIEVGIENDVITNVTMAALKETLIADNIESCVMAETVLTPVVPPIHAPKKIKIEAKIVANRYFITPETTGGPKTVDMLLNPSVHPKNKTGIIIARYIRVLSSHSSPYPTKKKQKLDLHLW